MGLKRNIKTILNESTFLMYNINSNQLINETKWIQEMQIKYFRLLRVIPKYPIEIYLARALRIIKDNLESNESLKSDVRQMWLGFYREQSDDVKVFMSHLFYYSNLIDSSVMKEIVQFLLTTSNKSYRYWLTLDIDKMIFFQPNCVYSEYYNDRNKLMKAIALESGIIVPSVKRIKRKIKPKYCIITYLLDSSISNSMQRVAMMMESGLKCNADEIMIVCLDSFSRSFKDGRSYNSMMRYKMPSKKKVSAMFSNDVKIKYARGQNYRDRMQDAIRIIYEYSPDIIVDIADEYSPMSYYYSRDFCTVYFPLRGSVSSQFYSSILGVPFLFENTNRLYNNCININKVIEWLFPEYVPDKQGSSNKGDIGITDDMFCILSIGNNASFSNDFVDEICSLLSQNTRYVWLLVGSAASEYLHQNYKELLDNKRVIEWGYEKNLAAICCACDALLRYDMTGGSGGTAIAAMQGLPIVMTNFVCDATRWLGSEYSQNTNYHDLVIEICKLSADHDYYQNRKNLTLDLIKNAIDSKSKWNELTHALERAYERWEIGANV